MSQPESTTAHWKVRVFLPGGVMNLASTNEPSLTHSDGELINVEADWVTDHRYGDTPGYVDTSKIHAISWRYSPCPYLEGKGLR